MRGKLNRRSVRAAYNALISGLEHIPSKQEMLIERTVKEWIWEYLLKQCSNLALLKALVTAFPIPDSSLRLKRMLLLKSLSFDVSEDTISERTLDAVSGLMELNKLDGGADQFLMSHVGSSTQIPGRKEAGRSNEIQDSGSVCLSLQDLHVAVKVECTILHLREEADDWPKFREALETHWGEIIQNKEEQDDEGNSPAKLELTKELWDVQKQPDLRHAVLQKYRRPFVKRMLRSFLAEAWRAVGPSFLEGVHDNLLKGLYVPYGNKTSICVLHSEREKAHFQAIHQEKVKESTEKLTNRNNLTSAGTDVQLLADTQQPQSFSAAPRTGKLIENLNSVPMDGDEAPMQGKLTVDGNYSYAGGTVSRAEKASGNEHKNETFPTGHGDASAETRSKCDLPRQEEEPSCPSPPPWIGSPSIVSGGTLVTSRSKRRKLAASFLDDMNFSKLVPSSGLVQSQAGIGTPDILKAQSELKKVQAQLNEAVMDPLPEALKVADEAAKTIETHVPNLNNRGDQGNLFATARRLPPQIGGSVAGQKDRREQHQANLMDRNCTAQTFEWETNDEIAESSDANSLSSSRQVRLPSFKIKQRVAQLRGNNSYGGLRRMRTRWTQEEENILRNEVERYGKGRWKFILEKNRQVFENRTEVDLKDKWRNIENRDGVS